MLSDRDRRMLEGIEQGLAAEDPALARRLVHSAPGLRAWLRPGGLAAVGVVLAVLLMLLGLVGQAFVVLALLGGPLAWRTYRARSERRSTAPGQASDHQRG